MSLDSFDDESQTRLGEMLFFRRKSLVWLVKRSNSVYKWMGFVCIPPATCPNVARPDVTHCQQCPPQRCPPRHECRGSNTKSMRTWYLSPWIYPRAAIVCHSLALSKAPISSFDIFPARQTQSSLYPARIGVVDVSSV